MAHRFLGGHGTRGGRVENRPQAFLAELDANLNLLPRFHQVDQFQLLLEGSASFDGKAAPLLAIPKQPRTYSRLKARRRLGVEVTEFNFQHAR